MPIDVEALAAINASPLPYDLFRDVHKGLRRAIFSVVEQAGRADYTDDCERQEVLARAARLISLLRDHHAREDDQIRPRLAAEAPRVAAMVDESDAELDVMVDGLERRLDALAELRGTDAILKGLDLYRYLAGIAAAYLAHMAFEEGEVMGVLRDCMSIGDLFTVDLALRTGSPPALLADLVADMAPALNVDERASLLCGLRSALPPDLFEQVRAAAELALAPADYQLVAARIALA